MIDVQLNPDAFVTIATDGGGILVTEADARLIFNKLGELLAKRTPDVDAQLQEQRDVAVCAYVLALARVEVLAAELSKRTKELLGAQEAHGAERRKVEQLEAGKARREEKKLDLIDALGEDWKEGDSYSDAVRQVRRDLRDARAKLQEVTEANAKLRAQHDADARELGFIALAESERDAARDGAAALRVRLVELKEAAFDHDWFPDIDAALDSTAAGKAFADELLTLREVDRERVRAEGKVATLRTRIVDIAGNVLEREVGKSSTLERDETTIGLLDAIERGASAMRIELAAFKSMGPPLEQELRREIRELRDLYANAKKTISEQCTQLVEARRLQAPKGDAMAVASAQQRAEEAIEELRLLRIAEEKHRREHEAGRAELANWRTEVAKLRAENATLHTQVAAAYKSVVYLAQNGGGVGEGAGGTVTGHVATEPAELPLTSEVARLRAEARRWYRADGTYLEKEPEVVIELRKTAARELRDLRREVERMAAALSQAEQQAQMNLDQRDGAIEDRLRADAAVASWRGWAGAHVTLSKLMEPGDCYPTDDVLRSAIGNRVQAWADMCGIAGRPGT